MSQDRRESVLDKDWSAEWDALPEAPPLVLRPKMAQITLRVPDGLLARLKRVANARSLPYHALARSWILEGLCQTISAGKVVSTDEPQVAQLNIKLGNNVLDDLKTRADELRRPYHRLAREWIEAKLAREEARLGLDPARGVQPRINDLNADGEGWKPAGFRARVASTRPVRVVGTDYPTAFARSALEGLVQQVRELFIPAMLEHLDYLPPIARWYDGQLVECADGHTELLLDGHELRHLVPRGDDPDVFAGLEGLPVTAGPAAGTSATLRVEPRNFEPEVAIELAQSCPVPLQEEMRWAGLPPIEWVLAIPVVWGATKFSGAFLEELGREGARALIDWVKQKSRSAREPERDRLITVAFELGDRRVIYAVVPVPAEDTDDDGLVLAFDTLRDVASIAGVQHETGDPFPGLERAAFLFDGVVWRLAWWTDGDAVYRTRWFDDNAPDPSRFLGHPLLEQGTQSE